MGRTEDQTWWFNRVCQSWSFWEAKPEDGGWVWQGIREAGNQMNSWAQQR